ncbi:MAG: prepilin-type N-terminal cleavage/methylation domain-containing protein [Deltaproteobacteria bacterium]|nr:prepilin-type N-terminal cleavage/methylation domain-containing protein [Deltaproteobacteria bacterium]
MRAISTRKRTCSGFTLVELLVCLALMAITFVSVFRLQAQNLEIQREARFITEAKYLAQGRLARLYAGGMADVGSSSGEFGSPFHGLAYEEEREEVAGQKNLYKVRIVVHRAAQDGDQQYVLETYVFQSTD